MFPIAVAQKKPQRLRQGSLHPLSEPSVRKQIRPPSPRPLFPVARVIDRRHHHRRHGGRFGEDHLFQGDIDLAPGTGFLEG